MQTYALFDNGTAELVIIKLLNVDVKNTLDIYFQSFRSPKVKESARRGIECAYEVIFSKDINIHIQKAPISVTVKDFTQQVDGSSAGIAYAIAFAAALKKETIITSYFDLPDKVAATGKVDTIGNITAIKCIKEKILAAISQDVDLMFYPRQNSEELSILCKEDVEFDIAIKNSGIKLKDVANIRQLFCEIGILPNDFSENEVFDDTQCCPSNNVDDILNTELGDNSKLPTSYKKQTEILNQHRKKKSNILKVFLGTVLVTIGVLIYLMLKPSAIPVSNNLALNKMAYASSNESLSVTPSYAFDGNINTRWASESSDNQWIFVDLGSPQTVSCVKLNWEATYAKQYEIQVSLDQKTWATVFSNDNNTGGENIVNFKAVSARYVKMLAWQRVNIYGYSLWEFEVYGSEITAPTSLANANADSLLNEYFDKVIDASEGFDNEDAQNLFDNTVDTKFCTYDKNPYVVFAMKQPVKVKSYAIATGNDTSRYAERNPKSWKVYGSNDQVSWELIDNIANGRNTLQADNKKYYRYTTNNTESYKYYKLELEPYSTESLVQLSELSLYGDVFSED